MTRLYEAAKALRGIEGQSDLARALNTSPQTVNNWEARGMSKQGMINAQKIIGCSVDWLASGAGPMVIGAGAGNTALRPVLVSQDGNPHVWQIQRVRLQVRAGITGFQVEIDSRDGGVIDVSRRWVEKHGYSPARLYSIEVAGDSMEPSLHDGDIIIINTADTKLVDGKVFVVNYGGEVVVKRLEKDGPLWYLTSDNPRPEYKRRLIRSEETFIIGKVVHKESDRI